GDEMLGELRLIARVEPRGELASERFGCLLELLGFRSRDLNDLRVLGFLPGPGARTLLRSARVALREGATIERRARDARVRIARVGRTVRPAGVRALEPLEERFARILRLRSIRRLRRGARLARSVARVRRGVCGV